MSCEKDVRNDTAQDTPMCLVVEEPLNSSILSTSVPTEGQACGLPPVEVQLALVCRQHFVTRTRVRRAFLVLDVPGMQRFLRRLLSGARAHVPVHLMPAFFNNEYALSKSPSLAGADRAKLRQQLLLLEGGVQAALAEYRHSLAYRGDLDAMRRDLRFWDNLKAEVGMLLHFNKKLAADRSVPGAGVVCVRRSFSAAAIPGSGIAAREEASKARKAREASVAPGRAWTRLPGRLWMQNSLRRGFQHVRSRRASRMVSLAQREVQHVSYEIAQDATAEAREVPRLVQARHDEGGPSGAGGASLAAAAAPGSCTSTVLGSGPKQLPTETGRPGSSAAEQYGFTPSL